MAAGAVASAPNAARPIAGYTIDLGIDNAGLVKIARSWFSHATIGAAAGDSSGLIAITRASGVGLAGRPIAKDERAVRRWRGRTELGCRISGSAQTIRRSAINVLTRTIAIGLTASPSQTRGGRARRRASVDGYLVFVGGGDASGSSTAGH